jgi:hypothetical protein
MKSITNLFKKPKKNTIIKKDILADMHNDGVRFDDEVIEKIKEKKELEYCHYSGLPSVYAYES